jgi:hypothetical protein
MSSWCSTWRGFLGSAEDNLVAFRQFTRFPHRLGRRGIDDEVIGLPSAIGVKRRLDRHSNAGHRIG